MSALYCEISSALSASVSFNLPTAWASWSLRTAFSLSVRSTRSCRNTWVGRFLATAGAFSATSASTLSGGKMEFFFFATAYLLLVFRIEQAQLERLPWERLNERNAETKTELAIAARGSERRDLVRLPAAASRFREGIRAGGQ